MPVVNYDWDEIEDNVAEEFDDTGTTIAEYTNEPRLHGNVISQRRNGADSVYHYDGQGSTLALTNAAGDVTDTYANSAFGEVTERTGNTVNPFQFGGQKGYYRDEETGEYEVRRRPLSSKHGRWLSNDPLFALWQQSPLAVMTLTNRPLSRGLTFGGYLYAANNPIHFVDPSGLVAECAVDCKGKELTEKLCIIYWGSGTLEEKDLKLEKINEIWKQCCVKFVVEESVNVGDDELKKGFPDDGVFDDAKEDHNTFMYKANKRVKPKNSYTCTFINVFKNPKLSGAEEQGGYFQPKHVPEISDLIVFDPAKLSKEFPIDLVLAHELGHMLKLDHCNKVDPKCDDSSLMHSTPSGTNLSESECKKANFKFK